MGAGPAHSAAKAPRSAKELSSLDPLTTVMRLRGSADGALSMSYLQAVRELVVDGEVMPFCSLNAFVLARYVPKGALYEAQILEVTYYLDPQTGALLDQFKFPGAQAPVRVPKYRTGPITVRFAQGLDEWEQVNPGNKGEASADFAPPSSVRLQRSVGQPWLDGNRLFIRSDEYGRAYVDKAKAPAVFYREWIVWRGDVNTILTSDAPSLPSEYSYAAMSSWRPWMKMGNTNGHTVSNGRGRKIAALEELPEGFYALLKEHDPDVLEDPEKALAGVATR
jgi:hypothetical protein